MDGKSVTSHNYKTTNYIFYITVCVHILKMRYTSFVSFRGVVGGF